MSVILQVYEIGLWTSAKYRTGEIDRKAAYQGKPLVKLNDFLEYSLELQGANLRQ